MLAKILFTAIAQPNPEDLGDFIALLRAQTFVEGESLCAFTPAGAVVMGVPELAGGTNPPARLLDQSRAREWLVTFLFQRHGKKSALTVPTPRDGYK